MNGIHIGNSAAGPGQAGSPVKESSFLYRETSMDDQEDDEGTKKPEKGGSKEQSTSPPPPQKGVPIRWQS